MSTYAGLVTRLAALAVDGIVLAIAVPVVVNGLPSIWSAVTGGVPGWIQTVSAAAGLALPFLYFTIFWWGTGQTAGGMLLGTVVRRTDGGHLGLARAAARAFVGLLLPVIWLAGMLSVLWDGRRRALHDRLFGTVVIYKIRHSAVVTSADRRI